MGKERIITGFLKLIFFLFVGLLISYEIEGAINPGSIIVSNAASYKGRPYESAKPHNKESNYGGEGIFSPEGEWTGGFDCSGLVSWCAGLRRRYYTGDLSRFTDSIEWENIQLGNLQIINADNKFKFNER